MNVTVECESDPPVVSVSYERDGHPTEWRVQCLADPAVAAADADAGEAGVGPPVWLIRTSVGEEFRIPMEDLSARDLQGQLSRALGRDDAAREVLSLYEPREDADGRIVPQIYLPRPCRRG